MPSQSFSERLYRKCGRISAKSVAITLAPIWSRAWVWTHVRNRNQTKLQQGEWIISHFDEVHCWPSHSQNPIPTLDSHANFEAPRHSKNRHCFWGAWWKVATYINKVQASALWKLALGSKFENIKQNRVSSGWEWPRRVILPDSLLQNFQCSVMHLRRPPSQVLAISTHYSLQHGACKSNGQTYSTTRKFSELSCCYRKGRSSNYCWRDYTLSNDCLCARLHSYIQTMLLRLLAIVLLVTTNTQPPQPRQQQKKITMAEPAAETETMAPAARINKYKESAKTTTAAAEWLLQLQMRGNATPIETATTTATKAIYV